jgi:hypothetical protein
MENDARENDDLSFSIKGNIMRGDDEFTIALESWNFCGGCFAEYSNSGCISILGSWFS